MSVEIIDKELERLEKLGVIEKTDYSPWAAPTVYVKKKIRICAYDSTGLNDCLKEINYPLPTAEDIFANLNGRGIFSKLDLSEAYLQIPVEERCAELLTINKHRRLYKIDKRIKVAPTIKKKKWICSRRYFGLARNLMRCIISPNQDDIS